MIHATLMIAHDATCDETNDSTVDIRQWLLAKFPGSTVIETDPDNTILQLAAMPFDAELMSRGD